MSEESKSRLSQLCLCCGETFNDKHLYETDDYAEIVKEELEGDACIRLLNDGRTEVFSHA